MLATLEGGWDGSWETVYTGWLYSLWIQWKTELWVYIYIHIYIWNFVIEMEEFQTTQGPLEARAPSNCVHYERPPVDLEGGSPRDQFLLLF